ncbi:MAG: pyroglutamyl-peptidase I [Methyloceanibacter sp.]
MAGPRVLITGFGPFPGVPDNPSAWLAETLADETRGADCEPQAQVLPTEWDTVAALTPRLYEDVQPRIMIHFGLCRSAQGFRIERSAHNRVFARADMSGALPRTRTILPQGPDRLDTDFPATALAAHLRASGFAASTSHSAGRYLCNFLYYRSLEWAARQERPVIALFMHIPPVVSHSGSFSEAELLRGAHETLRFTLDFADGRQNARQAPAGPALAAGEALLSMKDA